MPEVSRVTRGRGVRFAIIIGSAVLCAVAALAISMSESGDAAFPGANGRIAYSYGDAYQGSIWSANADGTSPAKLTDGTGDYAPAYSANGSRIAFGREGGIVVMNADGSGQTQIDTGTSSFGVETEWRKDFPNQRKPSEIIPLVRIQTYKSTWHSFNSPSFSPDGSQLAVGESSGESIEQSICAVEEEDQDCIEYEDPDSYFDYNYECVSCASHVITVNSATGAQISVVTPSSSVNDDYDPAYSPSGRIAFARWSGSGYGIFVVDSPGAAPSQVTVGPNDYAPDFSPDGSKIVFNHGSRELGVASIGGGPVRLLSLPSASGKSYLESPAFSPDGSRIAFERTFIPFGGKAESALYTMGADGSGPAKIVDRASAPSWQPVAPPPPPPAVTRSKARPKKGKLKLDKKAKATVGTIVCGSSPCKLEVLSATLKGGRKPCPVGVSLVKRLAPGKSAKLSVRVAGKCLAALKKSGKGALVAKVQVTDALGKKVLTFKSTLISAKTKQGGK